MPSAEKATENIAQTTAAEIKFKALPIAAETLERIAGRPAAVATHAGMAELVVALALARVFQDFVGFADFFELGLVTALFVGVMLDGQLAVGFLDLVGRSVLGYAQNFIIIAFAHCLHHTKFGTQKSRVLEPV